MPPFFVLQHRFPFVWNNPMGYFAVIILEYIVLSYTYFLATCCLSHAVGVYWLVLAIIKEIRHILRSINEKAHTKKNQSNEIKTLLTEYIQTHAAVKQLSLLKFIMKNLIDHGSKRIYHKMRLSSFSRKSYHID